MMTTILRPLTLSAMATLLVTAPFAASAPGPAADVAARTAPARAATPLPTTGLDTGPVPRIPYAHATKPAFLGGNFRVHRPDGTTGPLGYVALGQWSTVGRGVIGIVGTEVGPEIRQYDAHGTLVRHRFLQHFGLAISPDHSIVSWLDDRRRPHDLEGRGSREFTFRRVPRGDSVGAIAGSGTCEEQAPEGGGCTVFVNAAGNRGAFVSSSHGIVDTAGAVLHVSDVSRQGRVTGLVSRSSTGHPACWGVFGPGGHRQWQTCRYRLDGFSGDGRQVLAEHVQARWSSVTRFAILHRDGSVAHAFTFRAGPHRSLSELTWEDPHHLLGVLSAHGTWSIVRIGDDGGVEYAVAPQPAVNEFTPYTLPIR